MATTIIFKLKAPQENVKPSEQVETPVNLFFTFGYYENTASGTKKYIPLKYATGLKIKPVYWKDNPTYRSMQTGKFDYKNFNTRLDNIEGAIKKVYLDFVNNKINPSPHQLRDKLDIELDKVKEVVVREYTLNQFIENFIKEVKTGNRLTKKGGRYAKGTIKNFEGFKTQFDLFQAENRKKLNYEHITIDFYDEFVKFFTLKNYSPNTIGRHIKNLKTIMRIARDEGRHSNNEIDRLKFKILKVEVQNIYLDENELTRMYELDLSENKVLEVARDVFLIGCYTAQRFSDYSRINKSNIRTLSGGAKVIDLIQQKTGEQVIIPIRPELEQLLSKYDYNTPKIWEQKLNLHIKTVGAKAKIKEPVNIEKSKGGLIVKETILKHDLIKTHTARRAGCTNMYKAGVPTIAIMKISGHKTESEFLKYIKVSKEETAQNLVNHPYFTNTNLRKVN